MCYLAVKHIIIAKKIRASLVDFFFGRKAHLETTTTGHSLAEKRIDNSYGEILRSTEWIHSLALNWQRYQTSQERIHPSHVWREENLRWAIGWPREWIHSLVQERIRPLADKHIKRARDRFILRLLHLLHDMKGAHRIHEISRFGNLRTEGEKQRGQGKAYA